MNTEYSQCPDCKGSLTRIRYAHAYSCPECLARENDVLVTKLERIECAVLKWLEKYGHDKCHYYPEIFQKILNILQIDYDITKNNIAEEEFKEGCSRYRKEIFNTSGDMKNGNT